MINRIKTSSITAENLEKIQNKYHFSSKAIILRMCISLSLRLETNPLTYLEDFDSKNGFDISLQTLFAEQEVYYRAMIQFLFKKKMTDKQYAELIVSHIEQGMSILYGEFATTNSLLELLNKIA